MKFKIERVKEGSVINRPLGKSGHVSSVAPEDGVMMSSDMEGQGGLYFRASDLKKFFEEEIDCLEGDSFREE